MTEAHWHKGVSRMGFTAVYVVDQHGCLLDTEPACSIPDRYSDWFLSWLLQQPCPYPTTGVFDLLEHSGAVEPHPYDRACRNTQHSGCPCMHVIDGRWCGKPRRDPIHFQALGAQDRDQEG